MKNKEFWVWLFLFLVVAIILLTQFWIVANTSRTVGDVQKGLDTLQKNIEADHTRQTANQARILACLSNLFIDGHATESEVAECRRLVTTTDSDTLPEGQAVAPPNQGQSSLNGQSTSRSSSNNTTPTQPSQPDNPQSPPTPPEPPDNDGVIVDLPLIDPIHIPSPL